MQSAYGRAEKKSRERGKEWERGGKGRERTVGKAKSHDVPAADAGDNAEVNEEERSGDEPIHVTGNEKLPAIWGDNPTTAGGHGEV